MTCELIAPLLNDYLDGTLSPEVHAGLEAHLAGCAACQTEVVALRSIVADARALPRSVLPARDLWGGIAQRLEQDSVSTTPTHRQGAKAPRISLAPWRLGGTAPLLIAAGVAILIGGVAVGRLLLQSTPSGTSAFAVEQQRYTEATATLARQLTNDHTVLPQQTRAVVEHNLAIVDAAIHEAEQALTRDPGNTALEQMVLARYEQRLALLKRATDAGRSES